MPVSACSRALLLALSLYHYRNATSPCNTFACKLACKIIFYLSGGCRHLALPPANMRREGTHRHSGDLPGPPSSEHGSAGPEHLRPAYKSSLAGYRVTPTCGHGLQAQHSRRHGGGSKVNLPLLLPLRWLSQAASSSSAIAGLPNRQPCMAEPPILRRHAIFASAPVSAVETYCAMRRLAISPKMGTQSSMCIKLLQHVTKR